GERPTTLPLFVSASSPAAHGSAFPLRCLPPGGSNARRTTYSSLTTHRWRITMAATISAKDVMALRAKTGLGMMECKEALAETGGDVDAAVDLLRKKGLAKMDARTDRESKEGKIAVAVQDNPPKGAIIELNSETDFVAGNELFIRAAQEIADKALRLPAGSVEKNDEMQRLIDELRLTTKENVQ